MNTFKLLLVLMLVACLGNSSRPGPDVKDAVLWRNPGCVECKNFRLGSGGAQTAPRPPFRFVEEEHGGSNPKVKVKDSKGNTWIVKWGPEVKGEVFATRIAWAAGYYVRPAHHIAEGQILNVYGLKRAARCIDAGGGFHDASFRLIPKDIKWLPEENWSWVNNPFLLSANGQRSLAGLKVVLMLTSNWDTKDGRDEYRGANTAVYKTHKGSADGRIYSFDDWGASMGKWGTVWTRQKWAPLEYLNQTPTFVKGVEGGFVEWGFSGTHEEDITKGISVEDVAWIYRYLGRITDKQLRDGLIAAGAEPEEVLVLAKAIRQRLDQLKRASKHSRIQATRVSGL